MTKIPDKGSVWDPEGYISAYSEEGKKRAQNQAAEMGEVPHVQRPKETLEEEELISPSPVFDV